MNALAAKVWSFRARAEQEAALRFARLAEQLATTGAAPTVIRMARDAARDELEHAERCSDLAVHFGGSAPTGQAHDPGQTAPGALTSRERTLYEVVAMSCVTETLSAALLAEMANRARDGRVVRTTRAILRDEVQHSRLGWAHLASEHACGVGAFLADHLPAILAGTVADELFVPGEEPAGRSSPLLGALGRADRLAIFAATMRELVFPGLERFGVDTAAGASWLEHKAPAG